MRKKITAAFIFASLLFPVSVLSQWNIEDLDTFNLPGAPVIDIIANILFWLLAVLGIIGVIGFVISGLLYLTSAGNEGQIETAKRAMKYSIIGVIVGLAGLVVIQAVYFMLNGDWFF